MTTLPKSAQDQLRQYVEQLERLSEEQKALAGDVKEKMQEIKSNGFCTKTVRKILRLRQKSKDQRDEEDGILAVYEAALGMATTPLGAWAADDSKASAHSELMG